MPAFERYIGIDYSGAKLPDTPLKGIRVFRATRDAGPIEIRTPISRHTYWTRRGVAEWLAAELHKGPPTLVGIDHAFSFPVAYFEKYRLERTWRRFLEDFCASWRTGDANVCPSIRFDELREDGPGLRCGDPSWLRLTERVSPGTPKSVFRWHVKGTVANSTHAGLPWLLYLDQSLGKRVHFWPFDGWRPAAGKSVIAEVYPSLWKDLTAPATYSGDQRDAWRVAEKLRRLDKGADLAALFQAASRTESRELGQTEGWILGVKESATTPEDRSLPRGRRVLRMSEGGLHGVKPYGADRQLTELAGRYWLASQLLSDGVELAMPERDRGIDLIAYLDADHELGQFAACPIQVKAARGSVFSLSPKYERFHGLLLVYVWELANAAETHCYALTYGEAFAVAEQMGYTRTRSWRGETSGPAGYSTTAPSQDLRGLLSAYRVASGKWPEIIRHHAMKGPN